MRASLLALAFCLSPTFSHAQKSACDIDNPPANCERYYYATSDALVAGTGIPYGGTDPYCGTNQNLDAVDAVLRLLAMRPDGFRYQNATADLLKLLKDTGLYQQLANQTTGFVHDFLLRNGPRAQYANCATLAALIPRQATYRAYRLTNTDIDASPADPHRYGGCEPGKDCSNGFSRFLGIPELREENGVTAVAVVFANWSHNRRRVGHLTVFFEMPPGQKPVENW